MSLLINAGACYHFHCCRRVRPKMTPLIFLKIMGLAVLE
jgi:hypothetical protein